MILFSPAKINLGLHILGKREDGFHSLRSVMYPVGLCDILEFLEMPVGSEPFQFTQTGILLDQDAENNLVTKAWRLLNRETSLPPLSIHLHKQIPVGAGLGGGSSNASITLKGLNQWASPVLGPDHLQTLAIRLGSDCPFFLHTGPMMMEGRGEILSRTSLRLEGFFLVLLFPGIHISTAEAYAGVHPRVPVMTLEQQLSKTVEDWKDLLVNDFEKTVCDKYPLIRELKLALYQAGALYAAMSGSGSSIFGIFREPPRLSRELKKYLIWKGAA